MEGGLDLMDKGVNKMTAGQFEGSLSLTDKQAAKSQLHNVRHISMLWNLKVWLGQTVSAASIQTD